MVQTVAQVAYGVFQQEKRSRQELEAAAREQWTATTPANAQGDLQKPLASLDEASTEYRRARAAAEVTQPPLPARWLAVVGGLLIVVLIAVAYWAYDVGRSAKERWDVVGAVVTVGDTGYQCRADREQLARHVATFAPANHYKDEAPHALAITVIDAACASLAKSSVPAQAAAGDAAAASVASIAQATAERRRTLEFARVASMADALRTAFAQQAAGPAPVTQQRLADAQDGARELDESYKANLTWPWLTAMALLVVLVGLGGVALQRDLMGAMLTERNRLSLSKIQLIFWTTIVLSALLVTALFLLGASGLLPSPLPVYDERVWALLGIDIAAVAVAAGIRNDKARRPEVELPARALNQPFPNASQGALEHKISPHDWSFFDLFTVEDAADPRRFDATRFQHVIISLALFIVFFGMAFTIFSAIGPAGDWGDWAANHALPKINNTFLVLIVISHAGYLIGKAVPAAPA